VLLGLVVDALVSTCPGCSAAPSARFTRVYRRAMGRCAADPGSILNLYFMGPGSAVHIVAIGSLLGELFQVGKTGFEILAEPCLSMLMNTCITLDMKGAGTVHLPGDNSWSRPAAVL